jgi:hypothetical protein
MNQPTNYLCLLALKFLWDQLFLVKLIVDHLVKVFIFMKPKSTLTHMTTARQWLGNTSIVTLRVVGGDEKGSLESETVNYGHESHGSRTRNCLQWQGPGAIVNDRPVLSSERARHINKPATV